MNSVTILIADNEPAFTQAACAILEREGYLVKTASDGLEAVSIIKESFNGSSPIDLLITDLRMPKMSGMEIVKELNEKGIPITTIVVSGYGSSETLRELIHYGVAEFVAKPCVVAELVKAVRSALLKRKNMPVTVSAEA